MGKFCYISKNSLIAEHQLKPPPSKSQAGVDISTPIGLASKLFCYTFLLGSFLSIDKVSLFPCVERLESMIGIQVNNIVARVRRRNILNTLHGHRQLNAVDFCNEKNAINEQHLDDIKKPSWISINMDTVVFAQEVRVDASSPTFNSPGLYHVEWLYSANFSHQHKNFLFFTLVRLHESSIRGTEC